MKCVQAIKVTFDHSRSFQGRAYQNSVYLKNRSPYSETDENLGPVGYTISYEMCLGAENHI